MLSLQIVIKNRVNKCNVLIMRIQRNIKQATLTPLKEGEHFIAIVILRHIGDKVVLK